MFNKLKFIKEQLEKDKTKKQSQFINKVILKKLFKNIKKINPKKMNGK